MIKRILFQKSRSMASTFFSHYELVSAMAVFKSWDALQSYGQFFVSSPEQSNLERCLDPEGVGSI